MVETSLNQKSVYTRREKRAFYYLYYFYNSLPKNEEEVKKLEEVVKLINEARTLSTWNTTDIIWYGILQIAEKYDKEMLNEIAHDKYAPERVRNVARKLLEQKEARTNG